MRLIYTIFFVYILFWSVLKITGFKASVFWWTVFTNTIKESDILNPFFCIWTEEKAKKQVPSLKCFYSIQAPLCSEGMWIFLSVKFKKKRKIIKKCKFMALPPFIAACGAFCGKFQNKFWVSKPEFSLQLFCLMQPFTAPGDELLLNLN